MSRVFCVVRCALCVVRGAWCVVRGAVWGFAFFEFVDCSSQLFCRDLWDFRHLIVVVVHIGAALIFIFSDFFFRVFLFIVVEYFFVEFSKDIGNPFPRRDGFTLLILYLGDEHPPRCRFDSCDVLYTLQVFKYSLGVLLSCVADFLLLQLHQWFELGLQLLKHVLIIIVAQIKSVLRCGFQFLSIELSRPLHCKLVCGVHHMKHLWTLLAKKFNEWQRGHNSDTRAGDGMNVVLPFLHAIHVFLHVGLFITRP